MKCPNCGSIQDHVVDSRPRGDDCIKRRRECYSCKFRWNTIEKYNEEDKSNGRQRNKTL